MAKNVWGSKSAPTTLVGGPSIGKVSKTTPQEKSLGGNKGAGKISKSSIYGGRVSKEVNKGGKL